MKFLTARNLFCSFVSGLKLNGTVPKHAEIQFLILLKTVLQDTTTQLDFRVTTLEENGGDDGNSSVAELEVRVGGA